MTSDVVAKDSPDHGGVGHELDHGALVQGVRRLAHLLHLRLVTGRHFHNIYKQGSLTPTKQYYTNILNYCVRGVCGGGRRLREKLNKMIALQCAVPDRGR